MQKKELILIIFIFVLFGFIGRINATDVTICGTLSSPNTIYVLQNDVNSTGTCFTISAENVTLNCQQNNINFTFIGIYSNQNDTKIYNCNFTGTNVSSQAIYVTQSEDGAISDNNINVNGTGIYLSDAKNYLVSDNHLIHAGSYAIKLNNINSSNISYNSVDSASYGIYSTSFFNFNTISWNTDDSTRIYFQGANSTNISHNNLNRLEIYPTGGSLNSDNNISYNTFNYGTGGGTAVGFFGVLNNTMVSDNNIQGGYSNGIYFGDTSDFSTVYSNNISLENGICINYVEISSYGNISKNNVIISGSSHTGIWAPLNFSTIAENEISSTGYYAMYLQGYSNNILNNEMSGQMYMESISNSNILNNFINKTSTGIYLQGGNNCTFSGNKINSTEVGIYFVSGSNNTITDSIIQGESATESTFYINQFVNGKLKEIYFKHFPVNYTTEQFKLNKLDNQIHLIISQTGMDFADIDELKLVSCGKVILPEYVLIENKSIIEEILYLDNNVVSISGRELEIVWEIPLSCQEEESILYINANEYSSSSFFFRYPLEHFINYNLNLKFPFGIFLDNIIEIDGIIDEVDGILIPNYEVFWEPGTGHPKGYNYIYVTEDRENIYFSLDLTSDNSDDNRDWAEIIINTNQGEKIFRIDDSNDTWGKCGFGKTSKVKYKHSMCEFKIPKSEVTARKFDFALKYYGTASPPSINTGILFDYSSNNILKSSSIMNKSYGIYLRYSSSNYNSFYNNILNNTLNYYNSTAGLTNYLNTTLTSGTNIVNGPYIGGNYWAYPNGTGFSETCADANEDGICDNTYKVDALNYDYLPLTEYETIVEEEGGGSSGSSSTSTISAATSTTSITISINGVTAGSPMTYPIEKEGIDLTKLTIIANQDIQTASFSITKMDITQEVDLFVGFSQEEVYQAFKIDKSGFTNDEIENVTIEFKVEKSWVDDKDTSKIILERKENDSSSWGILETNLINEDENYYYFNAISPGFSVFVIYFDEEVCTTGELVCVENKLHLCTSERSLLIVQECEFSCKYGRCLNQIESIREENILQRVGKLLLGLQDKWGLVVFYLIVAIISVLLIIVFYITFNYFSIKNN